MLLLLPLIGFSGVILQRADRWWAVGAGAQEIPRVATWERAVLAICEITPDDRVDPREHWGRVFRSLVAPRDAQLHEVIKAFLIQGLPSFHGRKASKKQLGCGAASEPASVPACKRACCGTTSAQTHALAGAAADLSKAGITISLTTVRDSVVVGMRGVPAADLRPGVCIFPLGRGMSWIKLTTQAVESRLASQGWGV